MNLNLSLPTATVCDRIELMDSGNAIIEMLEYDFIMVSNMIELFMCIYCVTIPQQDALNALSGNPSVIFRKDGANLTFITPNHSYIKFADGTKHQIFSTMKVCGQI
jgi:hypothetical protein